MPCFSIRQTKVTFERVAYKAGHMALLLGALREMGYEVQVPPNAPPQAPPPEQRDQIIVSMTANKDIYLNKEKVEQS